MSKNFIQKAIKKPGSLRKALKIKKGEKIPASKLKDGGSALKPVDKNKNPGLAKLPTKVRNKMGYMAKGGRVLKAKGPGVMRPKPQDRYGQVMKPKPIKGKK